VLFSLSKDSDIYAEKSIAGFFNYPNGTRMIEVWDIENLPFKIDLIRERGKLKIIAVYPPID
jgi:hypothetical protein